MKKLLLILVIAVAFTACKTAVNDDSQRKIELLVDSTVYQNNNIYTDTVAVKHFEEEKSVQTLPKKSTAKAAPSGRKQVTQKSTGNSPSQKTENEPVATPPVVNNSGSNETVSTGNGNQLPDAGIPGDVKKEEKKGWSKAAQGAVIGGATGAVGGAIISKKKGLGAVIGGVVGAAGGYIIGKNQDKKEVAKTGGK